MPVVWDQSKSDWNLQHRGRSFKDAIDLMAKSYTVTTNRRNGEQRWLLWGYLDGEPWVLVLVVMSNGDRRAISLRPASRKERKKHYAKSQEIKDRVL